MRENMGVYRGKWLHSGEWVEGGLVRNYFEEGDAFIFCPHGAYYRVDPATVGECTGEPDKSGKQIFEGDVLEGADFTAEDGGYGVVSFDDGAFVVSGNNIMGTFVDNYCGSEFEVIGNIHDNPGLLGEEKTDENT